MTASFTIFVCSTFSDLSQEREGVLDAIRRLKLQHDSMEFFGARAEQPIETCLQEVRASDVLVVIVGHRYGSIVPELGISYSEAEYSEGFRLKKPCLVYMRDENVPILPKHMERDPEKLKRLERWKETLQARHTVATFQDHNRLAVQVAADLARTIQDLEEVAKARSTMEKQGRGQRRLFRGIDLGHQRDPLRSAPAKMTPSLFEEVCAEVLTCYRFEAAQEETLANSILGRNTNVGTGWIRLGVFFDSFLYVQQLFQEIGIGVNENVSRVLGRETYFSEDGPTAQLQGPSAVVIHSLLENVPSDDDIRDFGVRLKTEAITNALFFVNESAYKTSYLGMAERPLRQLGVNAVVLCLEDLSYQILTTEVYRKFESRLKWG